MNEITTIDPNRPSSTPLETNEIQNDDIISSGSSGADVSHHLHDILSPHSSIGQRRGGIRGHMNIDVSRATQNVVQPQPPLSQGGNTTATSTSPPPMSSTDTMVVESPSSNFVVSIVCFLIIAPCFIALILQLMYTCHQRKRARRERQLLAVSTNPTSRMLILSEILKNDCRPVTKDQASSKKNRVLVKKYRKKTPSERLTGRSTDEMETDESEQRHQHHDKEGIVVITESSQDIIDYVRNSNSWDVENPLNDVICRDERGTDVSGSDVKPTIVYLSEDVKHRFNSYEESTLELDNVSTLEEENETAAEEYCAHEADEEEGMMGGIVTGHSTAQLIERMPVNTSGKTTIDREVGKDDEINRNVNTNTEESVIDEVTSAITADQLENIGKRKVSHDALQSTETKDSPTLEFQSSDIALTPSNYSPTDSSAQLLPSENIHKGASLMEESSGDAPNIPLLNIFVTTPTKYPARRAPTPESMLMESNAMQKSSGVRDMPDLSDDDDDSNCRGDLNSTHEMGSIFRKGQCHEGGGDDTAAVGGRSEIYACGSSDTEVASNIDGLKDEQLDSFVVEPHRSAPSPFHVGNSSDWDIPLEKVESYKSAADYSLSSNVSYFSYEDVSIASDELDTCAICLCPYEEGDVRIFSKRCPHAFHKECILEWLVKSQNCPCCRIDIVTKSEIDEISASLIGTKRLAEAMAVSEMQEAPPFSVRRSRLARQLMARARAAQRLRNPGSVGHNNIVPSSSPSMRPPTSPLTPRTNNVAHSRDRFLLATTGFLSPPSPSNNSSQPRIINPSRSSDAIMNPHETHQSSAIGDGEDGGVGASIHTSNAGSLFTTSVVNQSMFHDHWIRQRQVPPPPMNLSLSPATPHPYWRQSQTQHSPSDIFRV